MDDKRIFDKLDKIDESLIEIRGTLIKQEENLREHMRRTEIAESNIEILYETNNKFRDEFSGKLADEIKPFKAHIAFFKGAIWALGIIGALIMALNQLGILQKLF